MSNTTKFSIRTIAKAILATLAANGPINRQEALGLIAEQATKENPYNKTYAKVDVTNPYNHARKEMGDAFVAVVKAPKAAKSTEPKAAKPEKELPVSKMQELEDRIEEKDAWAIVNKATREVVGYAPSKNKAFKAKTAEQTVVKTETLTS